MPSKKAKVKSKKTKSTLLNWMPGEGKGDPYSYETWGDENDPVKFPKIKLKILDKEEGRKFGWWGCLGKKQKRAKVLVDLNLNHHIKTIERLPNEIYELLMAPVMIKPGKKAKSKKPYCALYIYMDELKGIPTYRKVYIDYPMSKVVEVTIPPEVRKYKDREDWPVLGYYLKQIADAYGMIYKTMDEKVSIYAHGFVDLFFEGITFYEDNTITLSIGS